MMNTTGRDPAAPASALRAFVDAQRDLPLMPALALQLVRSVQDDGASAPALGRQIAADAGLSARLLRLANSSFYGVSRRIGTVPEAIAVLGFNLVRRIVLAQVLRGPHSDRLPDTPATRRFWRHQMLGAALARHVHAAHADGQQELAYMAGLLHDVGRVALQVAGRLGPDCALGADTADEDALVAAERASAGFDHAAVGAALLEAWRLPAPLVAAVARHADPTAPAEPLAASVWQAGRLARRAEHDGFNEPAPPWMRDADLSAAQLRRIVDEVDALAAGAH